jgi:hypothetical protein
LTDGGIDRASSWPVEIDAARVKGDVVLDARELFAIIYESHTDGYLLAGMPPRSAHNEQPVGLKVRRRCKRNGRGFSRSPNGAEEYENDPERPPLHARIVRRAPRSCQ